MTGKQILIKAKQSRIAALESLTGRPRTPRQIEKMVYFRTWRMRDRTLLEDLLFQSFDERRRAA